MVSYLFFALDVNLKLVAEQRVDPMLITLSDYIQHKYRPDDFKQSIEFFKEVDVRVGDFLDFGCVVRIIGHRKVTSHVDFIQTPSMNSMVKARSRLLIW